MIRELLLRREFAFGEASSKESIQFEIKSRQSYGSTDSGQRRSTTEIILSISVISIERYSPRATCFGL